VAGKLMDELLPDLLLGIDRGGRIGCKTGGNADIWLAAYPYDQPRILVSDPGADLRFPRWSPDGKWIAYVESMPAIINDMDRKLDMKINGSDSVWLIRPDGTDKHKISDDYPTFIAQNQTGDTCDTEFEIASNMTWSPDGKYLIYTYVGIEGEYYIFDIGTGNIKKVVSTIRWPRQVMWIKNGEQFYIQGRDIDHEYFRVTIDGIERISVTSNKIQFPEEMAGVKYFDMVTVDGGYSFYILFYTGLGTGGPTNPQAVSIWRYLTDAKLWELIIETDNYDWIDSIFLSDMVIIDEIGLNHALGILSPKDFKSIKEIFYGRGNGIDCFFYKTCQIYFDKSDQEWLISSGYSGNTSVGIWAIPLFGSQKKQEILPELLIDLSKYGVLGYRIDYSFMP
jgi:hypothetical protein